MEERIKNKISELITSSKVFLFMKGKPEQPQCGFSSQVIDILKYYDIEFKSFDVLSDPEIRQGIKDYTNWPTIPQLYINKEFIGGCDIITKLAQTKELIKLVNNN
jgi:monothiol glutaredoxin